MNAAPAATFAFNLHLYGWCLIGIVISVLLPPLWKYAKEQFQPATQAKGFSSALAGAWAIMKPYLALGAASAATALLLVAFLGDAIADPRAALLAGYAWDSTLQKLR